MSETLHELVERVQGPIQGQARGALVNGGSSGLPAPVWTLERVIKSHVLLCLGHFGGDVCKSAVALGVGKTTLYRWLHTWGIGVKR